MVFSEAVQVAVTDVWGYSHAVIATFVGKEGMVINPEPTGICVKGVIMVEYARVTEDICGPIVLTALRKGLKSLKTKAWFMGRQATVVERGERLDVNTELARLVIIGLVLKLDVYMAVVSTRKLRRPPCQCGPPAAGELPIIRLLPAIGVGTELAVYTETPFT